MPEQGWKLHISATMISAGHVIRNTLPVLLAEAVSFKVAATPRHVGILNSGQGGVSQVGKFITIYPENDTQAVRLAGLLHEATLGLRGPGVPSDRPLRIGSLVHYRYGAFATLGMQNRHGDVHLAIRTPSGELVPDERHSAYSPPEWAVDPFLAAGIADALPQLTPLVAGRYLAVTLINETPRGAVYKGVDMVGLRRCIIKQARRDGAMGTDGMDASDRLRNEARILALLSPDPRFPQAFDLFEADGNLFLVMEEVLGQSLQEHISALAMQGRTLRVEELVAWSKELAAMLADIHAKSLIYRDLKASNVIVAQDGRLRLIDFDVSMELPAERALYSPGTVGYMSWGQQANEPPRVEHDIYSLGALLYFMATGADPSRFPHPYELLKRPPEWLNPALPTSMVDIIARCLEHAPEDRFPSMQAVIDALSSLEPSHFTQHTSAPSSPQRLERDDYLEIARRLGDTLCNAAHHDPAGRGCYWINPRYAEIPVVARDLATGSAGPVLALAELVAEIDERNHRDNLREGARWLASQAPGPDNPRPGLYNGEAGVAVALLRAGQVLKDDALIQEAVSRGSWVAALPFNTPGIFNGTAGRLRFHLLLWDVTGDEIHLDAATKAGEYLVETAQNMGHEQGPQMLSWTMPPGDGPHDGRTYTGYALGASGVGDALLDLFDVTGDSRFLQAAAGAARWLEHRGTPSLNDASGLDWSQVDGEPLKGGFWGHGASGVGIFLLNAVRHGLLSRSNRLLDQAALTAAEGTRWAGPTLAYGLGGPIEFLLDAYQDTSNHIYLDGAERLADILRTFSVEREGYLFWPSEDATLYTPDYMVGYAGVAILMLRLAHPGLTPRAVTMAASRRNRLQAVHRKLVTINRR
jgi:serine/threonine protein kinase